jgi:hypothetical protein
MNERDLGALVMLGLWLALVGLGLWRDAKTWRFDDGDDDGGSHG